MKTGAVIPAYNVSNTIKEVIAAVPKHIDHIIVIDDHCPQGSGKKAESLNNPRVIVLYHTVNTGVGGAVITGYKKAIDLACDVIIKIDGDGQMDSRYIDQLIAPIAGNAADYTKGNRFMNFTALRSMPKVRLLGNSFLSFIVKIASGYWNIIDPTNGYTAVRTETIKKLRLDKISKRFFFEISMLIHLNIINAVVKDIDISARYGEEKSSLKINTVLFQFPPRLCAGLIKRIFLKYFLYDFNMASVYILLGLPLFIFGFIYGMIEWIDSFINGTPKTAGTIMLASLPIIVSFQMLLQAIHIDINLTPRRIR